MSQTIKVPQRMPGAKLKTNKNFAASSKAEQLGDFLFIGSEPLAEKWWHVDKPKRKR